MQDEARAVTRPRENAVPAGGLGHTHTLIEEQLSSPPAGSSDTMKTEQGHPDPRCSPPLPRSGGQGTGVKPHRLHIRKQ